MTAYWMDLSITAEEVLSAVVICNHCKHRTIEASQDNAADWIVKHHYKFHYGMSGSTKQVGDRPLRKARTPKPKKQYVPSRRPTPLQDELLRILGSHGPLTAKQAADICNRPKRSTRKAFSELVDKDAVHQDTSGPVTLWSLV